MYVRVETMPPAPAPDATLDPAPEPEHIAEATTEAPTPSESTPTRTSGTAADTSSIVEEKDASEVQPGALSASERTRRERKQQERERAVSYTHLTLPTICSV